MKSRQLINGDCDSEKKGDTNSKTPEKIKLADMTVNKNLKGKGDNKVLEMTIQWEEKKKRKENHRQLLHTILQWSFS